MLSSRKAQAGVLQLHLPERWPDLVGEREPLFRWVRYEGGRADRGFSSLREIPNAGSVLAIAPASRVLTVRVQLPNARAARQEKVLAYLVEDAVGSSPEEIHALAVGDSIDGAKVVAVVDRAWLKAAHGELEMQGYGPSRVVCESELLAAERPVDQRVWTVVCTATGGFIHLGGVEHVALDALADLGTPPLALNLAMEEHTRAGTSPDTVEVRLGEGVASPDMARWSHALAVPVVRAADWFAEGMDARACSKTDLLQVLPGRRSQEAGWIDRYKPAAALAAGILVVHGGLTLVDWWRMRSEAAELRASMESRFRKVFPDAKAVVDPALQMQRQVATLKRGSGEVEPGDMVALLGRIAPIIAGANGRARAVKYDKGQLSIDVLLPVNATKESFEGRLNVPGVRIQVENIQPGAEGVQIALKVTAS